MIDAFMAEPGKKPDRERNVSWLLDAIETRAAEADGKIYGDISTWFETTTMEERREIAGIVVDAFESAGCNGKKRDRHG